MDRVYETGDPFFASERRVLIDRDGDGSPEELYFDVGYQPLRDDDGRVYAIASVAVEVTKQVQGRRALEAARAEAEDANRAKSQFLTTMSHELRTPLNAIAGYSDLLLGGVRGELSGAQIADIERIKRSGQHLLSLINDILNFAKIEAGQVEFDVERTPVSRLITGLDELVAPQVALRGLHIAIVPADPSLVVLGDVEKIRQILLNLLSNAVKFTESGGEIVLTTDADDAVVRISVRDTGRGISSEQLATIFDPFVQVDRHLTPTSQQGVGLGLAISRDLARRMNGELTVDSTLGGGSTFTLTLPRAS
jgi:signal transduction histidine kinase